MKSYIKVYHVSPILRIWKLDISTVYFKFRVRIPLGKRKKGANRRCDFFYPEEQKKYLNERFEHRSKIMTGKFDV